jgi:hypothetical protein
LIFAKKLFGTDLQSQDEFMRKLDIQFGDVNKNKETNDDLGDDLPSPDDDDDDNFFDEKDYFARAEEFLQVIGQEIQ